MSQGSPTDNHKHPQKRGRSVSPRAGERPEDGAGPQVEEYGASRKLKGTDSLLEPPEGPGPANTSILDPRDPLWTPDVQNCKRVSLW